MKTLKALKITSILNSIFCICCMMSLTCLAINRFCTLGKFENIIAIIGGIALLCASFHLKTIDEIITSSTEIIEAQF